jgi:multidrug resistance efflux pump
MHKIHRRTPYLVALILLLVAQTGCQAKPQGPTATAGANENQQLEPYIAVTGRVIPQEWAALAAPVGGMIKSILVVEGDAVAAGQTLLEIDADQAMAQVHQAEAALQAAQASLALLQAATRSEQVRVASAAVGVAQQQAEAAKVAAELAPLDAEAAQAAVAAAQAAYDLARNGARPDELEIARQQVEQAKAQLYSLQGQRDAVGGAKGKPGYQGGSYEAAEGAVMAAEAGVTIADLSRQLLATGTREEQLRLARADLTRAQVAVKGSEGQERVAQQALAVSEAAVAQAEAQLALTQAPAMAEQLDQARAQVRVAEAALATAQVGVDQHQLRAPFAGTVTQIDLRPGEFLAPGVPVISLGNLAALQIETTDLDEIDVARVQVGRKATITFDAIPQLSMPGTVTKLALQAGAGSGGTTYKAIIELQRSEPRLRWGMTAFADIVAE